MYIETIPRKGYSFMGEPEFAMEPFPQTDSGTSSDGSSAGPSDSEKAKSVKNSDRWLTFGIIALILAGILLGAGIATFWISRFAPGVPALRQQTASQRDIVYFRVKVIPVERPAPRMNAVIC